MEEMRTGRGNGRMGDMEKTREILLRYLLYAAICLTPVAGIAQNTTNMQERIKELETENQRLRETTEFQMEEILSLRRQIKQPASPESISAATVYSDKWHISAGGIFFSVFFSGDALSDIGGGFTSDGKMTGYRASIGKGHNRISGTVYNGDYKLETRDNPIPGSIGSYGSIESDRTDIDLMWLRILDQNEKGGIALITGYKYLFSDKTVYRNETFYGNYDDETFEGDITWHMLNVGLYATARIFNSNVFGFFLSANASLGFVSGMTQDTEDTVLAGNVVDTYKDKSMAAWGFNASVGIQCTITRHGILRAGYRGQVLNGMDGSLGPPLGQIGDFYDGHQSMFIALDLVL